MRSNLPDDQEGLEPTILGINIDNLHLHGSDLSQLKQIAEFDPALANKIVDYSDRADRREHRSFLAGMVLTFAALGVIVGGAVYAVYLLGIVKSVLVTALILGAGHCLRVYKTGEWSETGWIASIVRLFRGEDK